MLMLPPYAEELAHTDTNAAFIQERGDAEELAKKVRVLCWVMTGPDNHKTKVIVIILDFV